VDTKEQYYIIELVDRSGKVVYKIFNIKDYVFKNLEPGEYKIRITLDKNNNQHWDVGNYFIRSEPERIIIYKTFDKKTVTPVRANWEVGPLVITF
ncbi:MAG: hypothetical protein ACK5WF_19545, partial [Cyclobacteriaceae bacterium]